MKSITTTFLLILILAGSFTTSFFVANNSFLYSDEKYSPSRDSVTSIEYEEGEFFLGRKMNGDRIFHSSASVTKISPDGKRYWNLIYNRRKDGRIGAREFINGKEIRSYDISSGYPMDPHRNDLIVSFESNQSAYIVLSDQRGAGNKWYVIINGKEHGPYPGIGKLSLTPQDKITYVAYQNNTGQFIVDGKREVPEGIVDFAYSPDGAHFSYITMGSDERYQLFYDGEGIAVYDQIEELTFSPDGTQFAYIASEGEGADFKRFVVLNGKKQKSYRNIRNLTFSPDGKRLVYNAVAETSHSFTTPEIPVVDGHDGEEYTWVLGYTFSSDSKKLAYWVIQDNNIFVILEGNIIGTYQAEYNNPNKIPGREVAVVIKNLTLSPSGEHFAYVVVQSRAKFIVIDGQKGKKYKDVFNVAFTPDGKYIRYNAMKGPDIFLVVRSSQTITDQ